MKTAGLVSEYCLLDFSCQSILVSQPGFDTGASFNNFDFGVDFLKNFFHDALSLD